MMEEIKAQVRSANDASERIKKTKRDKVKIEILKNLKYENLIFFFKLSQEDMLTMVLTEEIDGYKKKLKCPICNIEEKDAILTKCFHVFCFGS